MRRPTPLEEDALREIGEIAAGSAGAAIARMTGRRTTHVTSQLHAVPVAELGAALGLAGRGVAGAAVPLEGDLRGALLLAFPEGVATRVAAALQGRAAPDGTGLGSRETSALKELANVATGQYLRAFYGFLGVDVSFQVPAAAMGGWDALVRYGFLGTAPGAERVWAVASTLETGLGEGRLFLLLDAKGLDRVLEAVRRRLASG